MPVIRRSSDFPAADPAKATTTALLDRQATNSDHCEVDRVWLPAGAAQSLATGANELLWFLVLAGKGSLNGQPVDAASVVFALPGTPLAVSAGEPLDLLLTRVPRADRFDPALAARGGGVKIIDWKREPVLQSEHDARTRIYMATPSLVGTPAIKAEMIVYPPGTAAPQHHHEGAEHFQYIVSGRGTAVLDGKHRPLSKGDILYNYDHEPHYFFTDPDAKENLVFVEFFIPGSCKTVWIEDANVCAWLPTGKDIQGKAPVRDIAYHVHGDDKGI